MESHSIYSLVTAYFTEHNVLKIHPCCSVGQNFLPSSLRLDNNSLYEWTTLYLKFLILNKGPHILILKMGPTNYVAQPAGLCHTKSSRVYMSYLPSWRTSRRDLDSHGLFLPPSFSTVVLDMLPTPLSMTVGFLRM